MNDSDSGCLVILLVIIAAIGLYAAWDTKFVLGIRYNVEQKNLVVNKEPSDCEFMTAPLGSKHCHYEKSIDQVIIGRDPNNGRPVASYDGGKTWQFQEPDPDRLKNWPSQAITIYVQVNWTKVED